MISINNIQYNILNTFIKQIFYNNYKLVIISKSVILNSTFLKFMNII